MHAVNNEFANRSRIVGAQALEIKILVYTSLDAFFTLPPISPRGRGHSQFALTQPGDVPLLCVRL